MPRDIHFVPRGSDDTAPAICGEASPKELRYPDCTWTELDQHTCKKCLAIRDQKEKP